MDISKQKVVVASVQASPVLPMNIKTIEKACEIIGKAKKGRMFLILAGTVEPGCRLMLKSLR